MFKFKGISSVDMQVIIEEEEHFIARAAQRYEVTEIEGKDGAIFNELGYSVVERPIYVQCLNIDKIDEILAWLNGEGEFEYKGRKTTARFYSQIEPQRNSCIRIIDTTFTRNPFWTKANEEFTLVKDRKDKTFSGESIDLNDSAEMRLQSLKNCGNSRQDEEPTPETPIEIKSCGDNVNIFEATAQTFTANNNYLEYNDEENEYHILANQTWFKKQIDNLEQGETYTLSFDAKSIIDNSSIDNFFRIDSNITGTILKSFSNVFLKTEYKRYSLSFVPQDTTVFLNIRNSSEIEAYIKNIKIVKGIDDTYSPFTQGSISFEMCNKNFFGISKRVYTSVSPNTVSVSLIKGILNANVVSGAAHSSYLIDNLQIGGSYTVSWKNALNLNSIQLSQSDINATQNTQIFRDYNTTNSQTFVATTKCVLLNLLSSSSSFTIEDLQIEKGEQATEYEEHKSQTYTILTQKPFRKNGEYKDTFIRENGKWFEKHYAERRIFTGTEYWELRNSKTDTICFGMNERNINKYKAPVVSNWFPYGSPNDAYSTNKECIAISDYTQINIKRTCLTEENVAGFKKLLSEKYAEKKPLYADYVLKTPEDIECTEEQCRILDEIENEAKTYKNITHIYSTDNVSPNLEGTYFETTNEKINNEGNIQSRPILRLEKTVSEAVELTINDIRFKYNFNNDEYVEIDSEEKTVEYEGLNRNRSIEIGYDFPKLKIGNNDIKMHEGDCIIKILRKDRWL